MRQGKAGHDPGLQGPMGLYFGLLLLLLSLSAVPVFWELSRSMEFMDSRLLSLAPSILLLGYRWLGARRYLHVLRERVRRYQEFLTTYAEMHTGGELTPIFNRNLLGKSLQQERHTVRLFLSVLLLAVPFLGLALLLMSEQRRLPIDKDGLLGLVLAGSGLYVYTVGLLLLRVGTLSTDFLLAAASRSFLLMMVGYLLGIMGLFQPREDLLAPFLYFGLGLFPVLGLELLHQQVRRAFAPETPGAEDLKWEYLDGVSGFDIERLKSLGISDIQQLARVEPGWLSLCTLYPLTRIIDWIDQALLITYLREDILSARQFGIRTATDLRMLFRAATHMDHDHHQVGESKGGHQHAGQVLKELADRSRSKLSQEDLLSIGSSLNDDVLVDLLACMHNRHGWTSSSAERESGGPPV